MNNKNIISPRGRDFFLYRKKKRYAELTGISNCKNDRIKNLSGNKLIGRFSCLSVSKLANITSFYNGKAYYYVMNMDIDQLHIDKVYELDTTEHNGVEVRIPINNFNAKELDCLSFIENVYVECDGDGNNEYIISEFNKRKIHTFNNFKLITYSNRQNNDKTEILLGKIPYSVDFTGLWDYNDDWHKSWKDAMKYIYPCINIGDVDITPNRETLIYTDRTKAKLREVYENCILELTGYWNDKCAIEYDDFYKWADEITKWRRNLLELEGCSIEVSDLLPFNAKFKGHPEWDNVDPKEKKKHVATLMNTSIECLGTLVNGTMGKGRRDVSMSIRKLLDEWIFDKWNRDRIALVVPSQNGFSGKYFKNFLGFKYHGKSIIFLRRQRVSTYELKGFIRRIWGATMITDKQYCHFIVGLIKELYRIVSANSVYDDIMNSQEYQKYKKEHQDPRSYVAKHTGNITFTIIDTAWHNTNKKTMTIDAIVKYIKQSYGKEKHIVYATLDSPFLAAFHSIAYPNLIILSAAKNNMKYLEGGLPEWIRPIEELYTPDNRVLIKYKTAKYISYQSEVEFKYHEPMPFYVKNRIEDLRRMLDKYDIYRKNSSYYGVDANSLLDIIPEDVFDLGMMGEFIELKPFLSLSYKIEHNYDLYCSSNEYTYYVLLKEKKIRVCYDFYRKIKDKINKLLNSI